MSLLKNYQKPVSTLGFKNLTFQDENQTHLDSLNVNFNMNRVVWVRGDSSKSWLLRVMAALTRPTSGQYLVNGDDVAEMSFEEFLPYRLNISFSFAYGGILNNRTLKENVMLPFLYHGVGYKTAEEHVQKYLKLLKLEKFQNYRPAAVPGILRKVCCVARAIAVEPEILIMDDPMSAVGGEVVKGFISWIQERQNSNKPLSVFVASDEGDFFNKIDHETMDLVDGKLSLLPPIPSQKAVG